MSRKKGFIIFAIALVLISISIIYILLLTPTARAERSVEQAEQDILNQKYEEGISKYKKSIKLDPDNIYIRLALGQVYLDTEDFSKAEDIYLAILQIDSSNEIAQKHLFEIYLLGNRLDEADEFLQTYSNELGDGIESLKGNLDSAKIQEASKNLYEQGLKLIDEENYLDAIAILEEVEPESDLYSDAKAKISEVSKIYEEQQIDKAKKAAEQLINKAKEVAELENYEAAIDFLNESNAISNSSEASSLLEEYTYLLNQIIVNETNSNLVHEIDLNETVIEDGHAEFNISNAHFSEEVHPTNEDENANFLNASIYYTPDEGMILLDVVTSLTNLQSSEARVDSFVNMLLLYNNEETFNPTPYAAVENSTGEKFSDTDRTFIDPNGTNTLHFIFQVPEYLENEDTSLVLEFTLNDNKYRCVIRE